MNSSVNFSPEFPGSDLPTFEAALQELQELVLKLEQGSVPLQESIALVQRARLLHHHCQEMLRQAECSLTELTAAPDGNLVEQPFALPGAAEPAAVPASAEDAA